MLKHIFSKILVYFVLLFFGFLIIIFIFFPIFNAKIIIFPYAVHPFDICKKYPYEWKIIKIIYILLFFISYTIIFFKFYLKFHKKEKQKFNNYYKKPKEIKEQKEQIFLNVGLNQFGKLIKIEEKRFISKYFYNWNYRKR